MGTEATMQMQQGIQFALIFAQIDMGLRVSSAREMVQIHKQWASGPELQADTVEAGD